MIKTVEFKTSTIKECYRTTRKITLNGLDYSIGKMMGALREFRLFRSGHQYVVLEYENEDKSFIII